MTQKTLHYPSADGKTSIHAIAWIPEETPRGIVQIAHGMAEFIDRYDHFARHLADAGYLVTGNDHLGHGQSVGSKADWGYFAETNGAGCVLEDMRQLTALTQKDYPDVPYFLFGHSMGSFFTRRYLCVHGALLSGAIICGTGAQPAAALTAGKAATKVLAAIKGWKHRSPLIDAMAFGGMNKPFEPSTTGKDWLSRDAKVVQAYVDDERCGFLFTLNGYYGLFDTMAFMQNKQNLAQMPKALPVLFIAGDADPVGDAGKGVSQAAESFVQAGMQKVDTILYPKMRHEILNEQDNDCVYEDVVKWLNALTAAG